MTRTNTTWVRDWAIMACGATLLPLAGCQSVVRSPATLTYETATGGMGRTDSRQPPWTGRVLSRDDLQARTGAIYMADETYAEVNSRWLTDYYADFRAELSRQGVIRGEDRFDCARFSEFYSGLAQARFFRAAFHNRIPARALALGQIWYFRADGRAHAIVQALTERGQIFIEPQTGLEMHLTADERKAIYFQLF